MNQWPRAAQMGRRYRFAEPSCRLADRVCEQTVGKRADRPPNGGAELGEVAKPRGSPGSGGGGGADAGFRSRLRCPGETKQRGRMGRRGPGADRPAH